MPESGSGLVREYCDSDAGSLSDVPAFADKSAPTTEIVLAPDARSDLCITMSAPRGNAAQDAPRPHLNVAQMRGQAPALPTLCARLTESAICAICEAERLGRHAHAEHDNAYIWPINRSPWPIRIPALPYTLLIANLFGASA